MIENLFLKNSILDEKKIRLFIFSARYSTTIFFLVLSSKKINLIIYYDKTLNYLENDRFSVSSENELNMDYDINRMKRLIICFAENYTFLFFRGAYDIDQRDFPSLVSNQADVTST